MDPLRLSFAASSSLSYDPEVKAAWGDLFSLPEDLVTMIYLFLEGKELAALTALNTTVQKSINEDENLWLRMNARDFSKYASDSGALISTPSSSLRISAKDLYVQNLRESSCRTMRWVRSHAEKASSLRDGPGPREGTAIATACGGDALILVAGWSNSWPTIRNDTYVLDLNPLTSNDLAYLLHSMKLASSVTDINDVPFIAASELSSTLHVDKISSVIEVLSKKARAHLHAKSPARTGAVPMLRTAWKRVTPSSNLPRARYGHTATTVILSDESWALASVIPEQSKNTSSSFPSSSSVSADGPSLSTNKRLRSAATPQGGSIAPSPELRNSLQWHRRDLPSSPTALPPSMVASMNSRPEDYGKSAEGSNEVIVVFGGMFSGGYTNETNEVWLERVEMQTVANIDEDLKRPVKANLDKKGEEKSDDKDDDEIGEGEGEEDEEGTDRSTTSRSPKLKKFKGGVVADTRPSTTTSAAEDSGLPSSSSSSSKSSSGAVVIERKLSAEWRRVIPKNLHRLEGRGYHVTSYVPPKRCIWVSGGISNGNSIWSLQAISVDTWESHDVETSGSPPCARHGHSLTCIAKRVFVFGGGTGGDILREGEDLRDFYALDLDTMMWSQPKLHPAPGVKKLPSLKWTGRCHSATAVGCNIIIYGGSTETSDKVVVIDTEKMQLQSPNVIAGNDQCFPQPRYNHCALRVGRRIHMYGGWAMGNALSDHSVLDVCPYDEANQLVLQDTLVDGHIESASNEQREKYLNELFDDELGTEEDEEEGEEDDDDEGGGGEEEDRLGRMMNFIAALGFRGGVMNRRVLADLFLRREQEQGFMPADEDEEEGEGDGENDGDDDDDNDDGDDDDEGDDDDDDEVETEDTDIDNDAVGGDANKDKVKKDD
jgi:hypothetical protein